MSHLRRGGALTGNIARWSCGPKRELVIIQVRTALSISLAAAKAVVDAAPCAFATFPDEFAAEAFARSIAALRAIVAVRVAT